MQNDRSYSAHFLNRTTRGIGCLAALLIAAGSLQATTYEERLYTNDFSSDTVGEKPTDFDQVLPASDNVGTEQPFPISWQIEDGPVGALIVGESSQPARSLPGSGNQSLRLYDYTSQGANPRALVARNFVPNALNNRRDARLDFRFQRSTFITQEFPNDVLIISLGEFADSLSQTGNAERALDVRLSNEGDWSVGEFGGSPAASGPYDGDGVNEMTIVANAHAGEALLYDGPEGERSLPPFTFSVYLNGARIIEEHGFRNEFQLGKFAFVTGGAIADAEIDFVIDDLRVSGLRETEFVEFELDYALDFEDQAAGEAPSVQDLYVRPAVDEAASVVVDHESDVESIDGLSLRMFDNSATGRAQIESNFIPAEDMAVPEVRFDFTFRRSSAMLPPDGRENFSGLYAMLGAVGTSTGMSLHTAASRAFEIRLFNDGRLIIAGEGSTVQVYEEFQDIGTHRVSFFANAQEGAISYSAPDGEQRTLDGFSFSVFLNDALIDENRGFRTTSGEIQVPTLGRYGFGTGGGNADTNIDFVIDEIRVTRISDPADASDLPALRIARGEDAGTIRLSWDSAAGVNYALHHSDDLESWTPLQDGFTGDGNEISHAVAVGDAMRGFFILTVEE